MDQPAAGSKEALERFALSIPRIGAALHGGVFHGIVFKEDGSPDYLLIGGPEAAGFMTWQQAMDWAAALNDGGHSDWTLPDRRDTAVQFANARSQFKTDDYYWTREQPASDSAYAWDQYFGDGRQTCWLKDDKTRVRAVRRVPIQ